MQKKISNKLTIGEFAAIIFDHLKSDGISAILTGGAVVSVYTDNKYESGDADFISPIEQAEIIRSLGSLGFFQITRGDRHLKHPDCDFTVEFPNRTLLIGGEYQSEVAEKEIAGTVIKILSPTQSVMDRLVRYIAWKDIQGIDQAQWICEKHPIALGKIYVWVKKEGANQEQFNTIKSRLEKATKERSKLK